MLRRRLHDRFASVRRMMRMIRMMMRRRRRITRRMMMMMMMMTRRLPRRRSSSSSSRSGTRRRRCSSGSSSCSGGFAFFRSFLLSSVVRVAFRPKFQIGSGAGAVIAAPPAPHKHGVVGPVSLRQIGARLWRRRLRTRRKWRAARGCG